MEIYRFIQDKENAVGSLPKVLQCRGIGLSRILYQHRRAIVPRPGSEETVGCSSELNGRLLNCLR